MILSALAEVSEALVELRRVELVVEQLLDAPGNARALPLARALLALAKLRADDAEIDLHRAIDAHANARAARRLNTEMVHDDG